MSNMEHNKHFDMKKLMKLNEANACNILVVFNDNLFWE
jgi:hypothetical protein